MRKDRPTIFDNLRLYRIRIEQRQEEIQELEHLKKHLQPETYRRIKAHALQVIKADREARDKLIAIINAHPDALQRKVIYYRWVKEYRAEDVASLMGYADAYIRAVYWHGMKDYYTDPAGKLPGRDTKEG